MKSGVYSIINSANGKHYVGSAVRMTQRFAVHRHGLRRGTHHSLKLQRAWNKYGESAFQFKPLLICAPKDLLTYEQRAIDGLRPEYNCSPTAGSQLGARRDTAACARMSASAKGKIISPETRAKLSVALRGRVMSAETKAKIGAARLGNIAWLGRKHTAEARAKISAAQAGRPGAIWTETSRQKLSASLKDRKFSAVHRARISEGLRKFHSTRA